VDVLRFFTRLKCRLMPYLFQEACEAHTQGIPMMRAMFVEFPNDPGCDTLDRQYMLGEALLVAPVFSPDGVVDYYLPAGRWTNLLSGQVVEGGRWVREQHDFLSLPLMVRPNTVLPMGAVDERPDDDYADGVTFHVFELADGAEVHTTVPDTRGRPALVLHTRREGELVPFRAEGHTQGWQVVRHHAHRVSEVRGAEAESVENDVRLIPASGAREVWVRLKSV